VNSIDHISIYKPWKRCKLRELSHSAKLTIPILTNESTIIQAYTDAIYTHTQKKCSGGWATTQSALPLTKPPGLRGLIIEIKRKKYKEKLKLKRIDMIN